jgi:hypothetical protein
MTFEVFTEPAPGHVLQSLGHHRSAKAGWEMVPALRDWQGLLDLRNTTPGMPNVPLRMVSRQSLLGYLEA